MELEEMKTAIKTDTSLDDAFNAAAYEGKDEAHREGWKAWEWCQRQHLAKGLSPEQAEAMVSFAQMKAQRLGYWLAIHASVFGQKGVATLIM